MYSLKHIFRPVALLMGMVVAFALTSCSEDDGTVEEYPNWQATNEAYFNHLSDSVAQLISSGRTDWKRIKGYSKDNTAGVTTDYIIAHVESCGHADGTPSPLLTDTVSVHYSGYLLPSTSYNEGGRGYKFDTSFMGTFDASTAVATEFCVGGTVTGFATALQHMHAGDHWTIYVPYQLGYGMSGSSSIPAYSTLIFDVRLVKSWRAAYPY